jgi:formylglycine-generating enzyme required for sulfatase activity
MAPADDSSPKPDPVVDAAKAAPVGGEPGRRETLPLDEGDATIAAAPVVGTASVTTEPESLDDDVATRPSASRPAAAPTVIGSIEPAAPAEPAPAAPPPPSPLKPGDVFLGKYEIERLIGAGGMGSVLLAVHRDLGAKYAIKIMHSSVPDRSAVDRFKREAKTSAMVDHPNIVRVFDCGEHEGRCYIIMEYLPGESLRQRLGRLGRFSVEEAVRFAGVVCDVLEVMHETGVVHRDLKPDNIVFARHGQTEAVKILDFGIAKLATASVSGHLTQTGTVVGTPAYMSPEQCTAGKIDGRSDIYALGVILFQMLTGRLPFDSDNLLTMMYLHVNQAPPVAHEVEPTVPVAVSDVVMKAMSKSPADRYQSATRCAAALAAASGVNIPVRAGTERSAALAVSGVTEPPASGDQGTVARPLVGATGGEARPKRGAATYAAAGALGVALVAAGAWVVPKLFKSPDPQTNTNAQTGQSTPAKPKLADHFVEIPAGTATIGANDGDCRGMDLCKIKPAETPAHSLPVATFWIAKYEVTNKEYAEFVSATGHKPPHWRDSYAVGTESHPVTNVSWNDTVAYAEWRSKQDGVRYRLPTEAEWEYAARGGDGRMFPWGDFWNASVADIGNAKSQGSTVPVDQAPFNSSDARNGVVGLAGNVCEWTASQFAAYPGSSYTPTAGDLTCRVIRGGSFTTTPNGARSSFRAWQPPETVAPDVGFRLAADAPSTPDGSP